MRYKIKNAELKSKKEKALIPFVVIGDPDYETSLKIVKTIVDSGADVLELGLPFSDPMADGPTIQAADVRALKKNINTDICFKFIKDVRKFTDIPIGLLVYSNLVFQRGINQFYKDAKEAGVDSVLIADVPVEESDPYVIAARSNKVNTIFLVSPLTKGKRLDSVLKNCTGFVYLVSRLGVTGAKKELKSSTLQLIKRVRKKTSLPIYVGFGISTPEHVKSVLAAGADGAIVGSAIVKIIEKNLKNKSKLFKDLSKYIEALKKAT
jgi:tryptophan synthase alpha chain